MLRDVADHAFGAGPRVVHPNELKACKERVVVALGHGFGKEVRIQLPRRGRSPGKAFYTDWVLALVDPNPRLELRAYVGLEVQSIDTTGNYIACRKAYIAESGRKIPSEHGLNWENVNKRILPQIIYKARVLQREALCDRGLYFVVPETVFNRIVDRLGGALEDFPAGRGSVTFFRYFLQAEATSGQIRQVERVGILRTSVDTIAERFTTARDLPPPGKFEEEIRRALAIS